MNIKQAKEQIKNAMTAYFTKDERGNYMIPMHKQRPIFLMGPPGIGKTAIMEQVAAELGVGMLSYSMTHHTRQSALGLPYIEHKTYGDKEYAVSEYTMSEIIASIYDTMEESGIKAKVVSLCGIYSNVGKHFYYDGVTPVPTKVMMDFICEYESGECRTSDESLEVAWIPKEKALDYVSAPAQRYRFEKVLNFEGHVTYASYVTKPEFQVLSEWYI